MPLDKRVRRRLLDLASVYAPVDGQIVIPLTQETIAELVGGSRSTVNQIRRREQQHGLIVLERGRILVVDPDGLARRAR